MAHWMWYGVYHGSSITGTRDHLHRGSVPSESHGIGLHIAPKALISRFD